MTKSICIIDGHPDPDPGHLIHALCDAYAEGAGEAGHTVSRINVSALSFDFLTSAAEFGTPPTEPVLSERQKIAAADHLMIGFPLWLGGMPAKLRGFFEHAARADFFLGQKETGWPEQMMKGKSARILVSMGMPGLVYRFGMDEGGLKALERGILGLSGFKPLHHSIIGGAGELSEEQFRSWDAFFRKIGAEAV